MRNGKIRFAAVAALAVLALTEAASAFYSPALGRFLSRDPIDESGSVLVRQAGLTATRFIPRDPIDDVRNLGIVAAVATDSQPQETAKSPEQNPDELNLYNYARSSPTVYVDPLGLSSKCRLVLIGCRCSNKEWPVYEKSERAKAILGGKNGCVTLLSPKGIYCTRSCADIKLATVKGHPNIKALDHEACHACAFEDVWLGGYIYSWIPGDLTGHCNRNAVHATTSW